MSLYACNAEDFDDDKIQLESTEQDIYIYRQNTLPPKALRVSSEIVRQSVKDSSNAHRECYRKRYTINQYTPKPEKSTTKRKKAHEHI